MNYDTTIQKQKNTQREFDKTSKKASYKMKTPREIELEASTVYTSILFFEVQKEIYKAIFFCIYSYIGIKDGWKVYIVQNNNNKSEFKNEFKFLMKNVMFIYEYENIHFHFVE
uniref:Uncharacterized protein n=1 Tax=Lactuca sativa TaxID=4236 RepID=A0A9R1XCU9_LACSA|nr:hypothetical protein LSAT_V11C400174860 [Lactuca sativa]